MSFFEKSLLTLELPRVLEMLAEEAVSEPAKELAAALEPSPYEGEVLRRLAETTAAKTMMIVRGSPSFYGVKDVRPYLARADLGGALNTRELLAVASVLQCARLVRGYIADDSVGKTPIDYLFHALHANKFLEEKITSSILAPRRALERCSPITLSIASEILDLPEPLGPTIAVISFSKVRRVLSAKDLKP